MSIPYRTRRKLNIFGMVFLIFSIIFIIAWLCWVMWLQRYVIYEDGGARLDFSRSANDVIGEVAKEEAVEIGKISIYYNEGADAITTTKDLEPINGYFITNDLVKQGMDAVLLQVERLPAGTAVMIDMKGPYGSFFYTSNLGEATMSASTDIEAMDKLVQKLKSKGFYTIARISAFQDWIFVDNHSATGLKNANGYGWLDPDGYFWLNPTDSNAISWTSSVIMELRDMGFNEVMLDNFQFPNSDKYVFSGDKDAALQEAASKLIAACGSSDFALSFNVASPTFPLPDGGRSRIYIDGISATQLGAQASLVTFEDVNTYLVFLSETGDTRYDDYSVLRTLMVADEVEARKQQ